MSIENKTKSELSEWLDNTQRESWQLELIFSGFVVFLLLAGLKPYHELGDYLDKISSNQSHYLAILTVPYHLFRAAYYVMTTAIIFHVFLRGLWISTIGLRSISGDIDWPELSLNSKFETFLKKKIPSFDSYIQRIETYCSVSFAFTFLMFFSLVGLGGFFTILIGLQIGLRTALGIPIFEGTSNFGADSVIMLIFMALGLIYLVDFVSLGRIKKIKWLTPYYYPIYRFFGFITFASLYRPIYYNLIDYKLGKRLVLIILPLILVTISLMSLKYYPFAYIANYSSDSAQHWYLDDRYEDLAKEKTTTRSPSINAQIIEDNHLKLFVPYIPTSHDPTIEFLCPDVEPGFFTGPKLRGAVSVGQIWNPESSADSLLACMTQLWQVHIDDSLYTEVNFKFYNHPLRKQYGLYSIIPIRHLNNEEHFIRVDKPRVSGDTLKVHVGWPMWFYKG